MGSIAAQKLNPDSKHENKPSKLEQDDSKQRVLNELQAKPGIDNYFIHKTLSSHKKRLAKKNYDQETHFRQVQIEQLEASLKRMNSNLDIIREKQDNLTIRAPLDGQLTVLNVEMGESKTLGQRLGQINVI